MTAWYLPTILEGAEAFVQHFAQMCAKVNRERGLAWDTQFHVRAGVGPSIREAFEGLRHIPHDSVCVVERQFDRSGFCVPVFSNRTLA